MSRTYLAAALVVALGAAAPADAARERVATAPYTTASGVGDVLVGDTNVNGTRYGSATVHTRRGESRVSVSAADDGGLPVLFEIVQDVDGDGAWDVRLGAFCGKTDKPVRLAAQRRDVLVLINAGACGTGASAPTKGVVTARLA